MLQLKHWHPFHWYVSRIIWQGQGASVGADMKCRDRSGAGVLKSCYFLCRNVTLTGPVRVQFRPLFSRPPIVGAVKVSFIEQPSFTYNVSLARVSVPSLTLHAGLWRPEKASQLWSGGCKL